MRWLWSLLLLCLVSCGNDEVFQRQQFELKKWKEANGKVKVLSTIGMISDLVTHIGGNRVDQLTLIPFELDPHSYQLVKGDDEKLANADLIFFNGLNLEHGPSLQRYLWGSKKTKALGNYIAKLYPERILEEHQEIDPHVWMDISLWKLSVPLIVEALSTQDPEYAVFYQGNGEKLMQVMQQEHKRLQEIMQQVPEEKRYLVTSHDAFNYFTRAYLSEPSELVDGSWKERFAAPEGLAPDSQLSTAQIQFILDYVKKHHVHVLFPESNVNPDSIRKLLSAGNEHGFDLRISPIHLYGDAMGKPGSDGDSYLKMIRHDVETLKKEWEG